jgi:hypothetical protein
MNWTDVFPVLDDAMVDKFEAEASRKERGELAEWFAVQRVVNRREVGHIVSVSLFWKNIRSHEPDILIKDRAMFMGVGRRRQLLRFDPWEHYAEPLIKGALWVQVNRPDVAFRVYLAADLEFLIPDLVIAGCEVYLMKSSSIRHNPGAMWRFLAFEETDKLVTLVDADRAAQPLADIVRTETTAKAGLGFWRVPVWGELNDEGNLNYRPIVGCQMGSAKPFPVRLLMQALIWQTRRGGISKLAKPPGTRPVTIHGTVWPDYGFDEWFLQVALYPRAAFEGLLTFVPSSAKSQLLPLDIEYAMWANPAAEMKYFGWADGGCCGPAEEEAAVKITNATTKWRSEAVFKAATGLGQLAGVLQENGKEGMHATANPTGKPAAMRLVAFCTVCQNRLFHLKQTLPQTIEVVRQGDLAMAVVVDYACREGTARWVSQEYAEEIAQGRLVLIQVEGRRKFEAGTAKAVGHALAAHYAETLFNLDADNYLHPQDLIAVLRTAQNHRVFIGQQCEGGRDSFGRLFLPSWLYRAVGGYASKISHYGWEDVALIGAVLSQPGAALVAAPMAAQTPITHSDEARVSRFANHEAGMSRNTHIKLAVKAAEQQRHIPLGPTRVKLWNAQGQHSCLVDHFSIKILPPG